MKRFFRIVLWSFTAIFFIVFSLRIILVRTPKRMEIIAKRELTRTLYEFYGDFDADNKLEGPIIHKINNGLSFQWYCPLEWGDSASFFIDVAKTPFKNGIKNYLFRNTRMNYQTTYLQFPEGLSHFGDILPYKTERDTALLANFKLDRAADTDTTNVYHPMLEKETLFYLLQKGFFRTTKKTDDYSVVEFFEPIGWKIIDDKNKGNNLTNRQYTEKARVEISNDNKVRIILEDR